MPGVMRKTNILLAGLSLAFVVGGSFASKTFAVEGESITLSPTSTRLKVTAGDTEKGELTIINDGTTTYDFILYGAPYSVLNEDYQADFTTKANNADAYKWLVFAQDRYHAVPNQVLTIPYQLAIPKGAAPGGHYGVIFAETKANSGINLGAASINRQKRVGTIMYLTVDGKYRTGGEIVSQSATFLQFKQPLTTAIVAKNTGNADFLVKTKLTVSDVFGNPKYEAEKEYPILPASTRKSLFTWEQTPEFGLFKVSISSSLLDSTKTTTHYVLMAPLWGYLVLTIGILAAVMYVVSRRK
jgi:hypothetical protein